MTDPAPALTPRIVAYIASEEGIVPEAYLDSASPPVWTWSMGVAATSGSNVLQYKDKPQPIDVCLRAAITLLQNHYLPQLARAFAGHALSENQVAGALSFLWRNGHLTGTQWVTDFLRGDMVAAGKDFMNWTNHGQEAARCLREHDLFFAATWPSLMVPISKVLKPSYHPRVTQDIDVMPTLNAIMGASA